jgi:ribosomal protein S18 acetylase RimI-like enzyme
MTVLVRQATADDLELVVPMFDAYRRFYHLPPDLDAARHFLSERIRLKDSVIFVATDPDANDMGLGFAQLYPRLCSLALGYYGFLYDLFVSTNARRHGVGKQLLLAVHDYAREARLDRVELQTARTNAQAQALYESLGWTRDDIFEVYIWRCA